VIIAETGGDMSALPTAGHLASWAGMCPGNDESAGKRAPDASAKGSKWLRATLTDAAPERRMTIEEAGNSYLHHVEHVMQRKPSAVQD
jgi:transposase